MVNRFNLIKSTKFERYQAYLDSLQWQKNTKGAWSYYNNDASNNAKYGKLYNWYAISKTTNGNKNVCPTGWHVPTDSEWNILIEN